MIKELLVSAGIDAPPGSTRAMATSAAIAGGVDLNAILLAEDWSSASTFFGWYYQELPAGHSAIL